ncbi:hypothetical protein D3C87_253330 [compost metagenome]
MNTTNTTLKLLLLITVAATMAACSPAGDGSTDFASRDPSVTDPNQVSSKALAVCNQATSTSLSAQIKAGVNATTNQYRLDQAIVKLTTLPAGFTSGTEYLNLWRWMANSSNSIYLDQTPLNFYLYDMTTRQVVTPLKNQLSWSDVSSTASTWGLSAAAFFQRVVLVVDVRDAAGEFDVLKIASYNNSTHAAVSQLDLLLPLFYANPADYAFESNGTNRANVLRSLHPFKSMTGQGWSTGQFQSAANAFCF